MLDLKWCWICALWLGCATDSNEATTEREQDASVHDARVLDATADSAMDAARDFTDAHAHDAQTDAADAYTPLPVRDWMDVPEGPAPTPRERCAIDWQIPARDPPGSAPNSVPIASFRDVVADADGNTWVAGLLLRSFDFGTGRLALAKGTAAFVLKIDGECKLLSSKLFVAAAGRTNRAPLALGFDARQQLLLITSSSNDDTNYTLDFLSLDVRGDVIAEKSIAAGQRPPGLMLASRQGRVLQVDTSAYGSAFFDYGAAPSIDPTRGQERNVLFQTDGTPLRQDVFGTQGKPAIVRQRMGPSGEIVGWGQDVTSYYGAALVGPSIAKVDATGKLAWKHELYEANTNSAIELQHDVGEDGAIALWTQHGDGASLVWEQFVRELAPDGSTRWQVPITLSSAAASFFLHDLRMGADSIAAYGAIADGTIRVGHTALRAEDLQRTILMQVERGGALRWSLTFAGPEFVVDLDVTSRDEVVVAGYRDLGVGDTPMFVRVYSR